jgi:hypothetical protein
LATRRDDQRLDRRAGRGTRPSGAPAPVEHIQPVNPPATDTPGATPANPYENTPGHPDARGTLPMARHLTDLAIEDEIQALAAEAPLPTVDQAARLARLLRINRPHRDRAA